MKTKIVKKFDSWAGFEEWYKKHSHLKFFVRKVEKNGALTVDFA